MNGNQSKSLVVWNCREHPDWEQINRHLSGNGSYSILPVETGNDNFAAIIGPSGMAPEEAQQYYNDNVAEYLESYSKKPVNQVQESAQSAAVKKILG